ncbi:MAG: sugar phosphate isomerase/epimerase family protein [Vicinamibacteria bacterium]
MKWDIGLSTGIAYDHPIREILPYIADSGFRNLEISTSPGHLNIQDPEEVSAVARRIHDLGLRVHSLHAPFGAHADFTNLDPHVRWSAMQQLSHAARALELLGGHLYVIHPGGEDSRWVWNREEQLKLSVESLSTVWTECRARGLTLIIETPLPHLLGGQIEDFSWILDRLPTEGVGICLDTSHTFLGGTLYESIERFGSRLVHVQASDNRGHTDDHLVPGEGIIEWGRVLSSLERIGYQGNFMLEVTGHGPLQERVSRSACLIGGTGQAPAGWPTASTVSPSK